jgi:DNA-binding transcriptional ArsR family regulator
MVEDLRQMDLLFHALAHGARREMLHRLADNALAVGDLAEPLAMSLAAASKHIKVLERAGLVRQTVQGRRRICHLDASPMASASAWLQFHERHWQQRLDALQTLFDEQPPSKEK